MVYNAVGIAENCVIPNFNPDYEPVTDLGCWEAVRGFRETLPIYLCAIDDYLAMDQYAGICQEEKAVA